MPEKPFYNLIALFARSNILLPDPACYSKPLQVHEQLPALPRRNGIITGFQRVNAQWGMNVLQVLFPATAKRRLTGIKRIVEQQACQAAARHKKLRHFLKVSGPEGGMQGAKKSLFENEVILPLQIKKILLQKLLFFNTGAARCKIAQGLCSQVADKNVLKPFAEKIFSFISIAGAGN